MFALDHEQARRVSSTRCEYTVTPRHRADTSGLEPVTFGVSTGVAHVQDYLTPEQAGELARALIAGAAAAREATK